MQYLLRSYFPVSAPAEVRAQYRGKLQPEMWREVAETCSTGSLRSVAKEYGVSHETVRRTLRLADETVARKVR